jgi:hypothetical protein
MNFPLLPSLLGMTAVACGEPVLSSPIGVWSVSAVNGLTVPTPTTTGHTFRYGDLSLAEDHTGSLEYCTALPVKEGNHVLRWRFLDSSHLEFTYFNTGMENFPPDTAVLSGETLTWNAKVAEPQIGSSFWRLVRTSFDPLLDRNSCSPSLNATNSPPLDQLAEGPAR